MDPLVITVKRHGPYLISVDDADRVRVIDYEGNILTPVPGKNIALCRCGGSATKPFCDGTHKKIGFLQGAGDQAAETDPPSTIHHSSS
jgi:3-phenylpropionate/trans-cinnamate dioxygenase ferredoxin subunit